MTEESIFAEALALTDAAARAEYLDRVCADNADLRAAVEALLAAHAGGSPLDRSPTGLGRTGPFVSSAAAVGDRIGPYKLLEMIGEGGMGEVWVADQAEPIKRRVALKLIKPGMDSRGVLGRFEAERQALAVMDHPNIAKVLDAGQSADGRPYFVMELVKGVPITEFCDTRKLTPQERLELFVPVCQAIQHAHMKGIIHRDIKPSNVLVALHDEVPVPKVIDFGVAKAVGVQLTDKTVYTGFGTLIGTPAYMAPEQATFNQLDIDTRADVYALGVLLYELLAGSPPLEKERLKQAALDEVLRLVREEEPPRPSQKLSTSQTRASIAALRGTEPEKLSSLMRGELDWIVMKALEKDRTRRYETANGFAADIMRYLNGEPVQAVPPSLGYRLRKAYRKNKAAVWAGATFAALLLLGIVGTSLGWLTARDAEERALADRNVAIEARNEATEAGVKLLIERNAAQTARDEARRTHYAAQINLANVAFREDDVARCRQLLDELRPKSDEPDLRGPEWHYLYRQFFTEETKVHIPELVGRPRTLSRDGTRIVARMTDHPSTEPNTLALFDTRTGVRLKTFRVTGLIGTIPNSRPRGGMYNEQENDILTSRLLLSDDAGVIVYSNWRHYIAINGHTGKELYRLQTPDPSHGLTAILCGDGQRLVLSAARASDRMRRSGASAQKAPDHLSDQIIDLTTGKVIRERKVANAATLGISRDGKQLILWQQPDSVRIEDTDTGKEIAKIDLRSGLGPTAFMPWNFISFLSAELVDENKFLVLNTTIGETNLTSSSTSTLWEVATGKRVDVPTRPFQLAMTMSHGLSGLVHSNERPHCVEWVNSRSGRIEGKFLASEPLATFGFDKTEDRIVGLSHSGWIRTWRLPDDMSSKFPRGGELGMVAVNRDASQSVWLQRLLGGRPPQKLSAPDAIPKEGQVFDRPEYSLFVFDHTADRVLQKTKLPDGTIIQSSGFFPNQLPAIKLHPDGTRVYGVRLVQGEKPEPWRASLWIWDTVKNEISTVETGWAAPPPKQNQKNLPFAVSGDGRIACGVTTHNPTEASEQAFVLLDPQNGSILRTTEFVTGELNFPEFDASGRVLWGRVEPAGERPIRRLSPNYEIKLVSFDVATGKRLREIPLRGAQSDRESLRIVGNTVVYRRRSLPEQMPKSPNVPRKPGDGVQPGALPPPGRDGMAGPPRGGRGLDRPPMGGFDGPPRGGPPRQDFRGPPRGGPPGMDRGGPPFGGFEWPPGGGFGGPQSRFGNLMELNETAIVDAQTGREIACLKETGYLPRYLSVSPDGERVAIAYIDSQMSFLNPNSRNGLNRATQEQPSRPVVVYSVHDGRELYRITLPGSTLSVANTCFSIDSKRLLVLNSVLSLRGPTTATCRFIESATGRLLMELQIPSGKERFVSIRQTDDGQKYLLTGLPGRRTSIYGTWILDCSPLPEAKP